MKKFFYLLLSVSMCTLIGCKGGNTPDDPTNPDGPSPSVEECTMTSKVVDAHTIYEITLKSGEKIWCGIVNEVDAPTNLALVSSYAYYSDADLWKRFKYKGDFTFPSTFKADGKTYTITEIYGAGGFYTCASAFYECDELVSLAIPSSVTTIGKNAISYCYNLKSISIPESVIEIGYNAFEKDTSLVSVNLPASLKTLGGAAFSDCYHLQNINIPDGVSKIGSYLFWRCGDLKSIIIPKSVTTIGQEAFVYCKSIESVSMQDDGVKKIETKAFYRCEKLTSIVIPEGAEEIDDEAFRDCNLVDIVLPSTIKKVGQSAFYKDNDEPQKIICKATTPPLCTWPTDPKITIVYVPDESVELYKSHSDWKGYNIQPMSSAL